MSADLPIENDLRSLMGRFSRAGWVWHSAISNSGPWRTDFTPLGLRRMDELIQHLRAIGAFATGSSTIDAAGLGERFNELMPPCFSEQEFIGLIRLAGTISKRAPAPVGGKPEQNHCEPLPAIRDHAKTAHLQPLLPH